jgi:tight adherence protein C
LVLVLFAFVLGGGFRSWLLKEVSRNRLKNIEAELPSVLDLLAFAVSAGEPIITALQRVANTCTGELSVEIKRLTSGLAVGDNFLGSLDRMQREIGSQPLSRAFRSLIMAIERGTPISEVLRAQAMDSRNHEARKLMTLAGKKETMMMIPVVFLILPMIVIVALYPGLIALKSF